MLGVAAGGFGYDSGNDVLYAIARRPEAALYTVDYDLSDGPDPTATLVGPLGIEMRKHGADFFEGTLYAAAQYRGGPLALGSIDTLTGSFHELMLVGPRAREDIALAIVPEPASLGLLGLGALALLRYRRA